MTQDKLIFEDPPKPKDNKLPDGSWGAKLGQLRDYPLRWVRVRECKTSEQAGSWAGSIKAGKYQGIERHEFDARWGYITGTTKLAIWARWIPPELRGKSPDELDAAKRRMDEAARELDSTG